MPTAACGRLRLLPRSLVCSWPDWEGRKVTATLRWLQLAGAVGEMEGDFLITISRCFNELETLIREPLGCRSVAGMSSESGLTMMLYDGYCPVTNRGGTRSYSLQISAHRGVYKRWSKYKVVWMNWGEGEAGWAAGNTCLLVHSEGLSVTPNPSSTFLSFLPLFLPPSIA